MFIEESWAHEQCVVYGTWVVCLKSANVASQKLQKGSERGQKKAGKKWCV